MTEIINLGEVARLQRALAEKEREIETLNETIRDLQTKLRIKESVSDMMKLQLADMTDLVREWKAHLTTVEQNIATLSQNLPD